MKQNIFFIGFLGALIIYYISPIEYNSIYCKFIFIYTLVFTFVFLKNMGSEQKDGYFNFHTFFIISFILINFIHSTFIYPNDYLVQSLTNLPYYDKAITKDISIAQLGIFAYMFGAIHSLKYTSLVNKKSIISTNIYGILSFLGLLFSCSVLLYIIVTPLDTVHLFPRLMVTIVGYLLFCLFINPNNKKFYNSKSFIAKNYIIITACVLFIYTQLSIGSRAEAVYVILPLLAIYSKYVKKIKLYQIGLFIIAGVTFMAAIMLTRDSSVNIQDGIDSLNKSTNVIFTSITDFVVNIRGLHDGIYYADSYGLLYGLTYTPYLFVFIPYGGSFFLPLFFNTNIQDVQTAHILTEYNNAWYGLGTNIIGDLYMNFSLIGVILIMFLLGKLVQKSRQSSNVYMKMLYFTMLGYSIYLPRTDFLCWTSAYVIMVVLYWIFKPFIKTIYE